MTGIRARRPNAGPASGRHTPVIEAPTTVKRGEVFRVTASVGKGAVRPDAEPRNTRWLILYFHPEDDKFPRHIGSFEFPAHGVPARDPGTGGIYARHTVTAALRTEKAGRLYALSYSDLHGLRHSSKEIKLGA